MDLQILSMLAHRTDNELDVKAGFGSTIAAFVSAGSGASVGQMDH
ncbi:MAG: hypothetical protein CM15mP109_12860 [Candidatus Dadabacteria bacterium]|nr:MAG: hypothetical protein CM15mP109_12860 [Candidatus Dadabacteria bacterium]